MVILISKRYCGYLALFAVFLLGMSAILWHGGGDSAAFSPAAAETSVTVVIDPGHGGEDGGAVADDSTEESGLNLAVSLRLREILAFSGQASVMTRTEDVSLHSDGVRSVHEMKASDLKNRVSLINDISNAVLISVHQNSLPSVPSVHGAQVFYNTVSGGAELAQSVQDGLNITINAGNEKHCKEIPASIYLMKHATCPAILVECGFLSNAGETAQLKEADYQTRLATTIAAGFLNCTNGVPLNETSEVKEP